MTFEPKCQSCGVVWTKHLGMEGTCKALRDSLVREANYREALEWLVDEQNGPPLPTHAKNWRKAMREAARLLGRTESEQYYSDDMEAEQ